MSLRDHADRPHRAVAQVVPRLAARTVTLRMRLRPMTRTRRCHPNRNEGSDEELEVGSPPDTAEMGSPPETRARRDSVCVRPRALPLRQSSTAAPRPRSRMPPLTTHTRMLFLFAIWVSSRGSFTASSAARRQARTAPCARRRRRRALPCTPPWTSMASDVNASLCTARSRASGHAAPPRSGRLRSAARPPRRPLRPAVCVWSD